MNHRTHEYALTLIASLQKNRTYKLTHQAHFSRLSFSSVEGIPSGQEKWLGNVFKAFPQINEFEQIPAMNTHA